MVYYVHNPAQTMSEDRTHKRNEVPIAIDCIDDKFVPFIGLYSLLRLLSRYAMVSLWSSIKWYLNYYSSCTQVQVYESPHTVLQHIFSHGYTIKLKTFPARTHILAWSWLRTLLMVHQCTIYGLTTTYCDLICIHTWFAVSHYFSRFWMWCDVNIGTGWADQRYR